ncbi:hypothetical protein HAX54_009436 [Datura stramonium]|uniref:Isopenicillin N synthase-like Fe(2+) 2OG dioxygenase domain-containing protein n=1 Tax=Datura stramonium TaxID=4076 RepID=A0ABS8RW60_DATST|nr:hypothetical protein [Datura stramonium]
MDGGDRVIRRRKSLTERLGLKGIDVAGSTWGILPAAPFNVVDDENDDVAEWKEVPMNLAAALAAERSQLRAAAADSNHDEVNIDTGSRPGPNSNSGPLRPDHEGVPGNAPGTPTRMSLMRLLEETEVYEGELLMEKGKEEEEEEGSNDSVCCMRRKKEAAFILMWAHILQGVFKSFGIYQTLSQEELLVADVQLSEYLERWPYRQKLELMSDGQIYLSSPFHKVETVIEQEDNEGICNKTREISRATLTFTVANYPPCPKPQLIKGLRAHTDAGGITFCSKMTASGLSNS